MPVHNTDIAAIFSQLADLLEIQGANQYRVRAYRTASQTVSNLPRDAAEMLESGEDLSRLPGIGKDLAGKIEQIVETGGLDVLEEAKEKTPGDLTAMMQLSGLGAKRVKLVYDKLGVKTLDQLAEAANDKRLRKVPGLGPKTEQKILEEIKRRSQRERRLKLADVAGIAKSLVRYLEDIKGVKKVTLVGSYRRQKETVGDLDILVTCKKGAPVMDGFVHYDEVEKVISKGTTRSTVRLNSQLQVDVRVVPEVAHGAALHYFTGSKAHNIAVRQLGMKKKLKINEYGIFRGKRRIAGRTEKEVFQKVGLPYIEPELREHRGEIEAAKAGKLPKLVRLEDIRGDLHSHTKATDGHYSLKEMAAAAKERGYSYLAVTDHTKNVAMAKGLDKKRLAKQIKEIERLNEELSGIRLLKGSEVDILEDGSLDLDDGILKELDVTVCSIHSRFNFSAKKQTERVVRAMDNPHCNVVGHPTGRLIEQRDPYEIDIERLMEAALERGCFLEVNAQPSRLDLSDVHCRMAKEMGLKLAISTDAHHVTDFEFMRYGVGQARRGWLEPDDVINTRTWRDLKKLLKRR